MLLFFSESSGYSGGSSGACGYSTLKITDGTTIADLTDQTNYQLVDGGWAPSVAPLRKSTLGGSGPYEDVIEEIVVNVHGATAAACLANLAKLSQLLDQAERWSRGETVSAVRLQCQPWGSSLSASLECVILGRRDLQPLMGLPVTFNDKLEIQIFEVPSVRLRFVRRGQWLEAAESVGPSANTDIATVQTATFTSAAPILSPVTVSLAGLVTSAYFGGFVLLAKSATQIVVVEGESFVTSAGFTVVNDSAHLARGNSVMRYTPTGTETASMGAATVGLPSTMRRAAIFGALRNNSSAGVTWQVTVGIGIGGSYGSTPTQLIDASSDIPRLIYFGSVAFPVPVNDLRIQVAASSISGSPTLDFDYFVIMAIDDDSSRIISILEQAAYIDGLLIDPRALTDQSALATTKNGTMAINPGYRGDPFALTVGSTVSVAVLAVDTASELWRFSDGFSNVYKTALTVTRRLAYLTPQ
jgi:hypothetical protein